MFNKVFISHASEDLAVAEQLYDYLTRYHYEPWLDKKNILPGQNWNMEIRMALRKADFVVILLSKTAVSKRGYIQREFKLALEYLEEKLDSDIYIIPCKLDDCEVPDQLSQSQWVELKHPNSFDQIVNALNTQRKIYQTLERAKITSRDSFEFREVTLRKVVGDEHKIHTTLAYPQFGDADNEDLRILNNYLEYINLKSYNNFIQPLGSGLFPEDNPDEVVEYIDEEGTRYAPDYQLDTSYKVELNTREFISITLFSYHFSGGAHGMYGSMGYNYRLNPLKKFDLKTLLDEDHGVLPTLRALCKDKLMTRAKKELGVEREEEFFLYDEPLKPEWETFDNFYLHKDSLTIIFPIYQETPYALGEHEVQITFDELLTIHPNLKSLSKLRDILKI